MSIIDEETINEYANLNKYAHVKGEMSVDEVTNVALLELVKQLKRQNELLDELSDMLQSQNEYLGTIATNTDRLGVSEL